MAVGGGLRRVYLASFLLLVIAIVISVLVRIAMHSQGPKITIVYLNGRQQAISLSQMKRLPTITRKGTYQNQYGNWRDEGTYTGVRLASLIGTDLGYIAIRVIAADGYEIAIDRKRIEDPFYPMVLAYACDGVEVPVWGSGFRIVVLPEDGTVSNEEYGVPSAGSFWIRNVTKITLVGES